MTFYCSVHFVLGLLDLQLIRSSHLHIILLYDLVNGPYVQSAGCRLGCAIRYVPLKGHMMISKEFFFIAI